MARAYQIIWNNTAPTRAYEDAEAAVSVVANVFPVQWQEGLAMIRTLERESVDYEVVFKQGIIRVVDPDVCWLTACGGVETPFTYEGKTYLYMWNCATHEHAYYCKDDDVFYSNYETRELHR